MITGATGFIGRELYRSLVSENYNIRLLIRHESQSDTFRSQTGTEFTIGSLLDSDCLNRACSGMDIILHLAGVSHVSNLARSESHSAIVDGTVNLLNAAIRNNVRKFIYMSSSLAYAAEVGKGDITEYGECKRAAEVALMKAAELKAIDVVVLRPVNVYGAGMKGNIAKMISLIGRNRLPPLPAVRARISLVSVYDVIQALKLAMTSPEASGKTYTITDGKQYVIMEIESAIYAVMGKKFPSWRIPAILLLIAATSAGVLARLLGKGSSIGIRTYRNFTSDNLFDNSQISEELGFKPLTDLYKELPSIVDHMTRVK